MQIESFHLAFEMTDEDFFANLLETAYLEAQIDGDQQSLAYLSLANEYLHIHWARRSSVTTTNELYDHQNP